MAEPRKANWGCIITIGVFLIIGIIAMIGTESEWHTNKADIIAKVTAALDENAPDRALEDAKPYYSKPEIEPLIKRERDESGG